MRRLSLLPLATLVAALSCKTESDVPQPEEGRTVVFSAAIAETRTALGEKEGSAWANNWAVGDAISVNGAVSAPLEASFAGRNKADFTVDGVAAPYCAAYPASAVGSYANGAATVTIPAEQQYVPGSYDPAAYLMTAKSGDETLRFTPHVALFKLTPTGAGGEKIRSVSLVSAGGKKIAGGFTTDFSGLTASVGSVSSVKVTSPDGIALGEPWLIVFAAADFTGDGIQVIVEDTDGGIMRRAATPSKAYEAGKMYTAEIPYAPDPFTGNVHGTVTCNGQGVPDVLVSDGINIVKTDAGGHYALDSDKKWKYVFITNPSGYDYPTEGILPVNYKALTADADTPEQVDFELVPAAGDDYTLFVLGDMHLARRTGDLAQFDKVAVELKERIAGAPGKVYCLTLGDMTWDMYWIANNYSFSDYLQTMDGYFAGVPFFHTMGNHDNEMEVAGDYLKCLKYTEYLAPNYYSFNLGRIHYIVLDDMDFTGVEAGEENRSKYAKNITAEQLAWLRKDLSYVDKSTPVFVTAHEPLARPSGLNWNETLAGKDADLDAFIGIFEGYNVRFLSGHTHNLFNRNWTPDFTEHNSGAVCASWWWSGYITPGIHIAQDGAPGGYTVWNVKGTQCTHYYQAALQRPEYQFRAYDMNKVKETITADLSSHSGYPKYYNHVQGFGDNVILVNVWDYDDEWSVEISENGTPLEVDEVGVYDPLHIYAMTIPRLNKYNTTTFSTAKWRHFFQATASAPDTPVTVRVTDRYGKVYTEEMVRPKPFTVDEYKNEVTYTKPKAEFVFGSSSSLIFQWTVGGTGAEDGEVPYKIELFKDAACTNLQVSFDIPGGHSCWNGNRPRFVFGGLQSGTTYWFKVTNAENGDVSDPVEGQTAAFTVVDPSTVSNAAAGDVILAEDFGEVAWGPDEEHTAAGFFPSEKLLEPVTGAGEHSGSFVPYNSTGRRVYGDTKVTADKRLYNWGFFGNSAVYAYNGHLRVCTTSSGARTHIVSPALSGIPAGVSATVDVTVTACPTSGDNKVGVFVNDRSSLKLALAPDQNTSTSPSFSSQGGKYTGASLTGGYALEGTSKKLTTSTVRIEGVTSGDCLLIGSLNNVDTKNRFWLSDVTVRIVSLEDTPDLKAAFGTASSSSLSFTWTEGKSASDDVARPYTIALYKDAACSDLVVSHSISAGHSCWGGKQPRFVFGGLEQGTDYWFKVTDTTDGAVKTSNVVKATTLPFTRVDASTVRNAGVGDIILGEDFSEVHYGPDEFDGAAGFMPNPRTLEPITGENPDGSFQDSGNTGTRLWGNNFEITEGTRLSHGWGFYGNSAVYSRVGYFRCATTANNARTHIVTPKLSGIPDGFSATIEVTVTDRMYESNGDVGVFVCSNLTMNSTTDLTSASFCKYTGSGALSDGYALGIGTGSWQTRSVTIEGVTNQDQLLIGSLENINVSNKSKNRHNLSDIVVRIVSLNDAGRTTKVSIIGDSISTFKGWCDTTRGGAYYPKSDGDVTSVSDTWWHRLIYAYMKTGTFEKNISAGNTTVVRNTTGDSSAYWYGWDFGTRLQTLGIGNPDVVLIHGGTNDYGHTSWYGTSEELISGVAMDAGSFPSGSQGALDALFAAADAAATVAAADALDGTTFCGAYIRLVRMILARHPSAKVVCVIGDYLRGGQADAIKLIAAHFGEDKVRAADLIGGNVSIPKYSNPHPNAAGMAAMADFIYSEVGSWIDAR